MVSHFEVPTCSAISKRQGESVIAVAGRTGQSMLVGGTSRDTLIHGIYGSLASLLSHMCPPATYEFPASASYCPSEPCAFRPCPGMQAGIRASARFKTKPISMRVEIFHAPYLRQQGAGRVLLEGWGAGAVTAGSPGSASPRDPI